MTDIPRVWTGAEPLDDAVMTERQVAWDRYMGQSEVYPWPNWVLRVMQEGEKFAVQRDAMWRREVRDTERAARTLFLFGIVLGVAASLAAGVVR